MFEALLRLIGIGVRREPEPDRLAEAQAEARRRARQQWLSLTPEQKARFAEMERMLRNAEPRAYSPDQLRPMTDEELWLFHAQAQASDVMRLLASAGQTQLGEFSGIRLFGDATVPPGRIEARRSKGTVLQSDPSIATFCQRSLLGEKSPRELPKG